MEFVFYFFIFLFKVITSKCELAVNFMFDLVTTFGGRNKRCILYAKPPNFRTIYDFSRLHSTLPQYHTIFFLISSSLNSSKLVSCLLVQPAV